MIGVFPNLVHHNAATRNAAMHNAIFSHRNSHPLFLQRHRCDALPCFSASPVIIFYIAHIAFLPLLPFFLSPQWFTVQNNKKFTKSHNAATSPLATRDVAIANANANAAMRCTKFPKGDFPTGWFRRMFPRNENQNEGTLGCFPRTKNQNEGTFACSPGTKTGMRAHSPKPPFWNTTLLSPREMKRASGRDLPMNRAQALPTPKDILKLFLCFQKLL